MLKRTLGNISGRLLRAAVGRIASDLELVRVVSAASQSAMLVDEVMNGAKAYKSRSEVMHSAFQAAASVEGFVCELGVYRGASLNMVAKHYAPDPVHGFDTFSGLPEFWRDGFPEGVFNVDMTQLKFESNCVLYKGSFSDTLPKFLEKVKGPARLIHVDCDLYSSTIDA